MGFKTERTATTYFEKDGHTFELPFTGDFYRERLHVTDDGLTAVLGMLCQDEDAEDPFDGDDGDFYQFDGGCIHHTTRPGIDAFKRLIRENPGRVFTHNGTGNWHGPGTTRCLVTAGPFTVADTKNPKNRKIANQYSTAENALYDASGYYIIPEDATDPLKHAQGALDTYSAWCNGEVYGVVVWVYTRENDDADWGEPDRDSECWGYIGSDYAEQELEDQFNAAVTAADQERAA